MAETNETTQATTETKPQAKPVSEKVLAKRQAEKELRATVKPELKGELIPTIVAGARAKNAGSKAREVWDLYDGRNVKAVLDAAETKTRGGVSYAKACLLWDVRHGLITLEAPKAE